MFNDPMTGPAYILLATHVCSVMGVVVFAVRGLMLPYASLLHRYSAKPENQQKKKRVNHIL